MRYQYGVGVIVPFAQKFYKQLILATAAIFIGTFSTLSLITNAAAVNFGFTQTEINTEWEADRYFPTDGATSVTAFGREDVLRIGIDSTETQPGTFQRTEGLKTKGAQNFGDEVAVNLYLDPAWETNATRAGLWVVGDNGAGARDEKYGILEFVNLEPSTSGISATADHEGWRVWDSNIGWSQYLTTEFEYGTWVTLSIKLDSVNSLYRYSIDGVEVATASAGNKYIREVFLNSYNYGQDTYTTLSNSSYSAHWGGIEDTDPVVSEIDIYSSTTATNNDPGKWFFNRDPSTATPFEFNNGALVLGAGSLYVKPIANNFAGTDCTPSDSNPAAGCNKFIGEYFAMTAIEQIDSFSYDFKIGANGTSTQEEQFYLNVYANFGQSADDKFYDCRYNVVPTLGSTTGFTTVSFDPTLAYPVTTRTGGSASPFTCPAIPADMDTLSAGSNIRAFAINVGDVSMNDQNLDGYFDKVVLSLVNGDVTTFDFEPVILTNKEGCKNGMWALQPYVNGAKVTFKNQGDCVSYFATKFKNPPASVAPNNARR